MLRLLIKVKKRCWDKDHLPTFVEKGDITADCLVDLRVSDNRLSVWEITENEANLQRVITALAANCICPTQIDYLTFDAGIPARVGLSVQSNPGETPDPDANATWHRDLVEISGRKLLALAIEVFQDSSLKRCPEKEIIKMLKAGVARNEIDRSKVPEKLLQKIEGDLLPR
jgi:hypothetical protein